MKTIKLLTLILVSFIFSSIAFSQNALTIKQQGAFLADIYINGQKYSSKPAGWSTTVSPPVSLSVKVVLGKSISEQRYTTGGTVTIKGTTLAPYLDENLHRIDIVHRQDDPAPQQPSQPQPAENINQLYSGGNSKLHIAAREGNSSEISSLISQGISHINTPNYAGNTPL
ncbi:MAG: hypothetical protein KDD99_30650, partial [Bacteroidetes bacterium]|nr:hypothetical protein [Bacteroidota bacterium]